MAAFASCRRSGWVRLLVVILCALFIFATLAAPPAQALGVESVAVFGLASVLSAATAALGFKLANNAEGQATLEKMVQDFKTVAWATGFVLVGSKLNGLQNGMDYIKMQVQNGKTYLDSRVFAWVQQWLAKNGVYDSGAASVVVPSLVAGQSYPFENIDPYTVVDAFLAQAAKDGFTYFPSNSKEVLYKAISDFYTVGDYFGIYFDSYSTSCWTIRFCSGVPSSSVAVTNSSGTSISFDASTKLCSGRDSISLAGDYESLYNVVAFYSLNTSTYRKRAQISNYSGVSVSSNNTGLSGTDTLGKDVIDLTLDQILQKLKEWAQDWFDAGADSATNAATGALDLPLTVATGAATANPSIAEDGPLVWFPPFSVPIPTLRSGETDSKTVDQGKENASSVETSTDVAENQTVIDSLVNWALSYISPDTGLFSKFPLCVPYDAYLLVTSSLGVDAVGSDSIFGASPGDLEGVVSQDIETYSDFQPIINIKHDFELDGVTYPLDITIDLTPWQPLVSFLREGMAILLVAELIGSEFKRIRGH